VLGAGMGRGCAEVGMKAPITATCPVCGRRFRSPGDAPWCSVRCMGEVYREPEPAPVPDVGRGRAARTHRSAGRAGGERA
jgi:hypothetical protein